MSGRGIALQPLRPAGQFHLGQSLDGVGGDGGATRLPPEDSGRAHVEQQGQTVGGEPEGESVLSEFVGGHNGSVAQKGG